MRRGMRSSAPPAATSERLTSGIPIFAPLAATIRSQASAISMPPARAKPSTAAINGLREARWVKPAKPRSPNQADSPLTNAPRSIPALKKPPAPVSTPTESSSSSSSSSRAPATPAASAALTALRTSGRLSVINRTLPRRSVITASALVKVACSLLIWGAPCSGREQPTPLGASGATRRSGREQLQLGLALAAQQLQVDLDALDPARARQHARLRLDDLRREHAATRAERRVQAHPFEVAAQLLDGVDRRDPLDLDRDPPIVSVPAHQIDRANVRRPLPPDEPQALPAPVRRRGQQLLQLRLEALLLERSHRVQLVLDVRDDLGDPYLQPLLLAVLANNEPAQVPVGVALLLEHRRRRHPVQGLDARAAAVRPHHEGPVGLDHQQTHRLWQRRGQPAGVGDLAAGDDQAHRPNL